MIETGGEKLVIWWVMPNCINCVYIIYDRRELAGDLLFRWDLVKLGLCFTPIPEVHNKSSMYTHTQVLKWKLRLKWEFRLNLNYILILLWVTWFIKKIINPPPILSLLLRITSHPATQLPSLFTRHSSSGRNIICVASFSSCRWHLLPPPSHNLMFAAYLPPFRGGTGGQPRLRKKN